MQVPMTRAVPDLLPLRRAAIRHAVAPARFVWVGWWVGLVLHLFCYLHVAGI